MLRLSRTQNLMSPSPSVIPTIIIKYSVTLLGFLLRFFVGILLHINPSEHLRGNLWNSLIKIQKQNFKSTYLHFMHLCATVHKRCTILNILHGENATQFLYDWTQVFFSWQKMCCKLFHDKIRLWVSWEGDACLGCNTFVSVFLF